MMTDESASIQSTTQDTTPPQPQSWWIWIAWLERDGGGGFVYGCAAHTFRSAGWADERYIAVPDVGRLSISQRVVSESIFSTLEGALNAGAVSPEFSPGRPGAPIKVMATRQVLQECLGHSAVQATLYYTQPDVSVLIGVADGALEAVLSVLQDELNLPFKSSYAARLGNFEIFDLHGWLDGPRPFLIEVVRDPTTSRSGPQIMQICRTPPFAKNTQTAHLVGRVAGDVIVDRLIELPADEQRTAVAVPDLLDQFDFRLFDADGIALHFEHSTFMNRIGFVLSPIGRQMTIEDDLSTRAKQKGSALVAQASTTVSTSPRRSMIGAPVKGSWRRFAEDIEDLVAAHLPTPSEDKWFPQGIEGEVGAISHLNHLLNGGNIHSAVLVDPWFGADSVRRFVLRLGSQNVHLTVVTSWTNIDPDTGGALDVTSDPTEKLEVALRQVQPFLNPRPSIVNLVDGKDQAFHDRYLLLYPHEGPAKAFLLSNSINKMAGNWPFSMSLFSPDVSRKVQRYIEGLCAGKDTARGKSLTVSFRWP